MRRGALLKENQGVSLKIETSRGFLVTGFNLRGHLVAVFKLAFAWFNLDLLNPIGRWSYEL